MAGLSCCVGKEEGGGGLGLMRPRGRAENVEPSHPALGLRGRKPGTDNSSTSDINNIMASKLGRVETILSSFTWSAFVSVQTFYLYSLSKVIYCSCKAISVNSPTFETPNPMDGSCVHSV